MKQQEKVVDAIPRKKKTFYSSLLPNDKRQVIVELNGKKVGDDESAQF